MHSWYFTGLIPGIHINLVGVSIVSLSASLLASINPLYLLIFIVATAITHTFLDFIPSVFLGCPDTDTELSILPGHELLKKGQGYSAIMLTAYGSLAAIFLLLIITWPSIIIISKIQNILPIIIPGLLVLATLFLISTEKNKSKAIFAFLLTGILGLIILNLEKVDQPLLPLLTGLFGGATILLSIKNKTQIPKQTLKLTKTKISKPILGALIASPICSFLPGLGSGQAAIIGNSIAQTNKKGFLILLGATNTLVMGFSFISLYAILKTRTGAASAIKEILGTLETNYLILILLVILISGVISFYLTKNLAKFFSHKITKINYTKISLATLLILTLIVVLVSGFWGLLILIISTLTGIYCIKLKVKRTLMMGCLMLQTILWYLF
ncbi:MAG: tripartite tricarboxylate transporter permease [Nanoarchaeota archaeon]|nr:tripartite tricarboxylate transporter permease [Nanoarchaeota archaeon]MBU1027997.1 tripartite tricarboxylate transporter permease [Nanoarchaeota archaeon]